MELHEDIVRRSIVLDADRDTAWEALADPRALEGWLAPVVDVEIRPGARGAVVDHDGTVRETVVEEVTPGRRLALRWQADGEEPTIVELTLDDTVDGRTRLTVVEVPAAVVRAIGVQIAGGAFQGPALVAGGLAQGARLPGASSPGARSRAALRVPA